jgi:hypothetical protein
MVVGSYSLLLEGLLVNQSFNMKYTDFSFASTYQDYFWYEVDLHLFEPMIHNTAKKIFYNNKLTTSIF